MTTIHNEIATPKNKKSTDNPSALLISIRRRYPNDSRFEIIERFVDVILVHEACNSVIIREWASLNFNKLTMPAEIKIGDQKRKVKQTNDQLKENTKRVIRKNMINIVLMDMILPSGKDLRNSTGAECMKCGGWLAIVGNKIGLAAKVGDALSEDDLRHMWKAD